MRELSQKQVERFKKNCKIEPMRCVICNTLFFRNKIRRGRVPQGVMGFGRKTCCMRCSKKYAEINYMVRAGKK
ncbi:MAG: hypothetical protein ACOC56_03075 [Atribacterota bacterium]